MNTMDTLLSPRRRAFVGALFAAPLLSACGRPPGNLLEFGGPIMGSRYRVKLAGRGLSASLEAAARAVVAAALGAVDGAMSTYSPQSELSRFNALATTAPVPLSAQLLTVLSLANDVSATTSGAFDVKIGRAHV